jgi:hypothetical protein
MAGMRMRFMRLSAIEVTAFVGCSLAVGVACSIGIQRDLSAVPPGQVGFDDMCGLQDYFDALEIKTSPPPRVVSALDLEGASGGKVVQGGRERFAFENDFQLKHLRRVLEQNWKRLPDPIAKATEIDIEVKWSEKAGTKRVLTDQEAELSVGQESWALPYHVCLSELLYGEPLYRQRRVMWNLPLPKAGSKTAVTTDAGVPQTGDGGVPSAAADGAADGRPSNLK